MKIAVLGTGMVGNAIGSRLVELGHTVMMGSRTATNEKAVDWVKNTGAEASAGTFADAAAFGEILFNCTKGLATLDILRSIGTESLNGKVLVDIANTLDFSNGMPPTLTIVNDDSLGEAIQREFPELRVVKSLNTMNATLMVKPRLLAGHHNVFVSGNDEKAKETVKSILHSFGWQENEIVDLGDITTARGTEQLLPIWVRLYGKLQTPMFNFSILQQQAEQVGA